MTPGRKRWPRCHVDRATENFNRQLVAKLGFQRKRKGSLKSGSKATPRAPCVRREHVLGLAALALMVLPSGYHLHVDHNARLS